MEESIKTKLRAKGVPCDHINELKVLMQLLVDSSLPTPSSSVSLPSVLMPANYKPTSATPVVDRILDKDEERKQKALDRNLAYLRQMEEEEERKKAATNAR
jgi:hypothetical protein